MGKISRRQVVVGMATAGALPAAAEASPAPEAPTPTIYEPLSRDLELMQVARRFLDRAESHFTLSAVAPDRAHLDLYLSEGRELLWHSMTTTRFFCDRVHSEISKIRGKEYDRMKERPYCPDWIVAIHALKDAGFSWSRACELVVQEQPVAAAVAQSLEGRERL